MSSTGGPLCWLGQCSGDWGYAKGVPSVLSLSFLSGFSSNLAAAWTVLCPESLAALRLSVQVLSPPYVTHGPGFGLSNSWQHSGLLDLGLKLEQTPLSTREGEPEATGTLVMQASGTKARAVWVSKTSQKTWLPGLVSTSTRSQLARGQVKKSRRWAPLCVVIDECIPNPYAGSLTPCRRNWTFYFLLV